ncbi:hypothetical protein [Spiroplasma poulsonii]|nr:hypothetical protein [Spiroplasma poulsonii]
MTFIILDENIRLIFILVKVLIVRLIVIVILSELKTFLIKTLIFK